MAPDPMIQLVGVSKLYPGASTPAVHDLNVEVMAGELVVLVGPSGCGKTTTLRVINRLVEPTSGYVAVDGRDVTTVPTAELRRGIGYVIQAGGLLPHRTVAENVGTVPSLLGWPAERIRSRTLELLELMGLDIQLAGRYPLELSGGQIQRVGVARALAADPPVLLMDEPFGAVDPVDRGRLQRELLRLQENVRKTIVFVTHDIDEAILLADRMAIYDVTGRIVQFDRPEEVLAEPANGFVEEFLGEDRSLRAMSLRPVSELTIDPGPAIDWAASTADAVARMNDHDAGWITIVDGNTLVGWAHRADVEAAGDSLAEINPVPFSHTMEPTDTQRRALDLALRSPIMAVPVLDEGTFIGHVLLEQLGVAG